MIFKQRLFTLLLGLLFATVLTDQASALYDPGVGRFCSRDPIGYEGSQWNLHEYADSIPCSAVDPMGLQGHFLYCAGIRYAYNTHGCCNGKLYDIRAACCESGKIVAKVSLWRCIRNDYGFIFDWSFGLATCPLGRRARHSYVCCDGENRNCFDAQKATVLRGGGGGWMQCQPDLTVRPLCIEYRMCPSEKSPYCRPAIIPVYKFPGPTCHHHAGNWGCQIFW